MQNRQLDTLTSKTFCRRLPVNSSPCLSDRHTDRETGIQRDRQIDRNREADRFKHRVPAQCLSLWSGMHRNRKSKPMLEAIQNIWEIPVQRQLISQYNGNWTNIYIAPLLKERDTSRHITYHNSALIPYVHYRKIEFPYCTRTTHMLISTGFGVGLEYTSWIDEKSSC